MIWSTRAMRGKLSQHPNLAGLRLFRSQIPASET